VQNHLVLRTSLAPHPETVEKAQLHTRGEHSVPHLEDISQPAHTSGKINPHFIGLHVLPWLGWWPCICLLEVRMRSRHIHSRELICSPVPLHLLPPGPQIQPFPQQTVINSRKGTRIQVQKEAGNSCKHFGRAHFIQMFLAINRKARSGPGY
jgi:hypothetical protein